MKHIHHLAILLVLAHWQLAPGRAQELQDLYRLSENSFDSHVEYHDLKLHKGAETTLADLKGPREGDLLVHHRQQ